MGIFPKQKSETVRVVRSNFFVTEKYPDFHSNPAPTGDSRISLFLIESNGIVMKTLVQIIQKSQSIVISGAQNNWQGALSTIKASKPSIVLLTEQTYPLNGPPLYKIKKDLAGTRFAIFLEDTNETFVLFRLLQGFDGVFHDHWKSKNWVEALHTLNQQGLFFPHELILTLIRGIHSQGHWLLDLKQNGLTEKEKEILKLVKEKDTEEEVARELRISRNTVKTHLKHIFHKLGVHNKTQAVVKAISQNV